MNNFAEYLTVERAVDEHIKMHKNHPRLECSLKHDRKSLTDHYTDLAQQQGPCENCGDPIWRYGGTGLCFTCTTGEADASDDYELELIEGGKQ